tara:strand:- start:336 stop:650 length:315 start_codon:yes stop_codon:yes gene_type:complete
MASITYTKKDIVRRTAGKINVSQDDMKVIFDSTIDTIKDIFMEQQSNIRIEIRNFGVFEIKPAKAKLKARNPKTNEIFSIPSHRKVSFKPGKNIKQEMMKEWKI